MTFARRDRIAMELALECLRTSNGHAVWSARTVLYNAADIWAFPTQKSRGVFIAELVDKLTDAMPRETHLSRHPMRVLRVRMALLLRATLRADREDFGPMAYSGCTCSCDGDRGGWQNVGYVTLWEQAPAYKPRRHEVAR